MIYDLEDGPVYNFVTVNGWLTFDNEKGNLHLKAKHIFVRAGQINVGSATTPFKSQAQITLHGEKESAATVYDNFIEAGNKVLANTGRIKMFGKPRANKMSRLRAPVLKGASSFTVEAGLDWVAGDRIGLVATTTAYTASDEVTILTYSSRSGVVTFNQSLDMIDHYHWGNLTSTAWKYNGVDIRGEVVLLTRNVKIVGEDIQGWGG